MATVESPSLPDPPDSPAGRGDAEPVDGLGWRFLITVLLLATAVAGGFATLQARADFPVPPGPATTTPVGSAVPGPAVTGP